MNTSYTCLLRGCKNSRTSAEDVQIFSLSAKVTQYKSFLAKAGHPETVKMEDLKKRFVLCLDHFKNLQQLQLKDSAKFKCLTCSQSFSTLGEIQIHADRSCTMPNCPKANLLVTQKKRKKKQEVSYDCPKCGKSFTYSSSFRNHIMVHNNDRPFPCTECDKSFTTMTCLKTHIKNIHSNETFYCKKCEKVFKSERGLNLHIQIHIGHKRHKCNTCSKMFIDKQSLKTHERIHTGVRPYQCDICKKNFIQLNHLKTHKLLHSDDKPFECNICHKKFRQVSNLSEHLKKNHQELKTRARSPIPADIFHLQGLTDVL